MNVYPLRLAALCAIGPPHWLQSFLLIAAMVLGSGSARADPGYHCEPPPRAMVTTGEP